MPVKIPAIKLQKVTDSGKHKSPEGQSPEGLKCIEFAVLTALHLSMTVLLFFTITPGSRLTVPGPSAFFPLAAIPLTLS